MNYFLTNPILDKSGMDYNKIQPIEDGEAQVEPTILEGETTGWVF
jgi:hypothetical protein